MFCLASMTSHFAAGLAPGQPMVKTTTSLQATRFQTILKICGVYRYLLAAETLEEVFGSKEGRTSSLCPDMNQSAQYNSPPPMSGKLRSLSTLIVAPIPTKIGCNKRIVPRKSLGSRSSVLYWIQGLDVYVRSMYITAMSWACPYAIFVMCIPHL